jgi:hypothetical protein
MNKDKLINYLELLDAGLAAKTSLYIYGSAALMLLDEPERMSLDIDIASVYSEVDQSDLRHVATQIGLPVNPAVDCQDDYIEWIAPMRLCLPPPADNIGMVLWQGAKLTIKTGFIAELIASKLIRYDETDLADIQFLLKQYSFTWEEVCAAANRLPSQFRNDIIVKENLKNLKNDITIWANTII